MAKKNLQQQKFLVLRPIRYKNPDSPLYRKRIAAGEAIVDFPHLTDQEIKLLIKVKRIAPATASDLAILKKAQQDAEKAERKLEEKKAQSLADQKASAMAKMIQKLGE